MCVFNDCNTHNTVKPSNVGRGGWGLSGFLVCSVVMKGTDQHVLIILTGCPDFRVTTFKGSFIVLLQEYVSELRQLLTSAKHPCTISLLEKALAEATSPTPHLNGDAEVKPPPVAAEGTVELDMKPIRRQKDGSVSMAKINNYGMICLFFFARARCPY